MRDTRKYKGGYGGFGRQLFTPSFVGFQRPAYETDGTAAKKPQTPPPPKRQERFNAEEPQAPIRAGERFMVRIELVKNGVTRVVEGMMEVMESMWIFTTWVFKVTIKGVEQFFLWRLDWILAGRAAWWSQPRRLQRSEGADTVGRQPAPTLMQLPAPQPVAGYLPAVCA